MASESLGLPTVPGIGPTLSTHFRRSVLESDLRSYAPRSIGCARRSPSRRGASPSDGRLSDRHRKELARPASPFEESTTAAHDESTRAGRATGVRHVSWRVPRMPPRALMSRWWLPAADSGARGRMGDVRRRPHRGDQSCARRCDRRLSGGRGRRGQGRRGHERRSLQATHASRATSVRSTKAAETLRSSGSGSRKWQRSEQSRSRFLRPQWAGRALGPRFRRLTKLRCSWPT